MISEGQLLTIGCPACTRDDVLVYSCLGKEPVTGRCNRCHATFAWRARRREARDHLLSNVAEFVMRYSREARSAGFTERSRWPTEMFVSQQMRALLMNERNVFRWVMMAHGGHPRFMDVPLHEATHLETDDRVVLEGSIGERIYPV